MIPYGRLPVYNYCSQWSIQCVQLVERSERLAWRQTHPNAYTSEALVRCIGEKWSIISGASKLNIRPLVAGSDPVYSSARADRPKSVTLTLHWSSMRTLACRPGWVNEFDRNLSSLTACRSPWTIPCSCRDSRPCAICNNYKHLSRKGEKGRALFDPPTSGPKLSRLQNAPHFATLE